MLPTSPHVQREARVCAFQNIFCQDRQAESHARFLLRDTAPIKHICIFAFYSRPIPPAPTAPAVSRPVKVASTHMP